MSSDSTSGKVLALVGPTATGKSLLAEELALGLDGEIVSADSMQVYRGMDVGTAKVPEGERRVTYHCVDVALPGQSFSAALYQRCARDAFREIHDRGRLPVLVGGTGLYVRAAVDDWEFPPGEADTPLRRQLEEDARREGPEAMHRRLEEVDPGAAALIPRSNVRRTLRALEMAEQGVSYAEQARRFAERKSVYDTLFIGLTMEREKLYALIDRRVDSMVASGLLDEVQALLEAGYRKAVTASQAIGYKELVPVLEDQRDLADAVEEIKRATRRYAKRQLTWFRADPRVRWIDVTEASPDEALDQAMVLVESWEGRPRTKD